MIGFEEKVLSPTGQTDDICKEKERAMHQVRIQRKVRAPRETRNPILSLDPRDPDVVRAKQSA